MRNWDLMSIILLSTLLVFLIIFLPENPLRIVLGLAFLLFFPGYSLISFLFPEKGEIDTIERIALSFGLSIAIIPLIGLILNYTPFGIKLEPILLITSLFNVIFSSLAILRRKRALNPFFPEVRIDLRFKSAGMLDKALTIVLIVALFISVATLVYIIMNPRQSERFTEFYILGPKGKAADYPTKLFVNQTASVIIGIVNHEQITVNYTIEIWLLDVNFENNRTSIRSMVLIERFNVTLEHKPLSEKWEPQWEKLYNFSIDKPGHFKIFFLLFKDFAEPLPKFVDYAGTEAEKRILDAIDGKIQCLILNVEVRDL